VPPALLYPAPVKQVVVFFLKAWGQSRQATAWPRPESSAGKGLPNAALDTQAVPE
jgi:hypothetical protein